MALLPSATEQNMQNLQHAFRTYVDSAALDGAIALYEGLEQMSCARRVTIPETRIVAEYFEARP
jgi:hypothetical protein